MGTWLSRFPKRLRALIHRHQLDQDLADELNFHREMLEQAHGPATGARRFGNQTLLTETSRDLLSFRWLEMLWRDLRYGARSLRRAPVMTGAAILSLALGIGAATTIYSLIDTLLLHAISARDPQRVVRFSGLSYQNSRDIAAMQVFQDLASYDVSSVNWHAGERTQALFAQLVGASFFDALQVAPVVGRVFHGDEAEPARQPHVAVLTYRLWQRQFHGDRDIAGRTMLLNGTPYTVLGVLPRDYRSVMGMGISPEIYVPLEPALSPSMMDRSRGMYRTVARLREGRTLEQTRDELYAALAHLQQIYPEDNRRILERPAVESITDTVWMRDIPEARPVLTFASIAVGASLLVMMIACANAGGLLLARTAARAREVAIRLSIGASRRRILQQMMIESALLALAGIAGSLAITSAAAALLQQIPVPVPVPIEFAFALDWRLLAVACALGLAATLLCGLPAALHGTRTALATVVKLGAGTGFRRLHLRNLLVAGQFAVSVTLLAASFLFVRSFVHVLAANPGFEVDRIVSVNLQPARGQSSGDLGRRLLEQIRTTPGVAAAACASYLPLSFETGGQRVRIAQGSPNFEVGAQWVGPGYFATMQIPMVAGREFEDADLSASDRHPIIVNQAFADRYFAGKNPVGMRVIRANPRAREYSMEIVGVARNTKLRSLGEAFQPLTFLPEESLHYVVRAEGPANTILATLSRVASETDPTAGITVKPLREHVDASTWPVRFGAASIGMFATLGLLLAAVGLYGSMAYAVAHRKVEIGVRMALGAGRAEVLHLILRDGLRIVAAGSALGLAGALLATRSLESLLADGLSPRDPLAFAGVVVVLSLAGLTACVLPAMRAVQVDPNCALRHE
ncbi:MAG TPA: ABC transporter permease [Bryobacteraceae bacterium]|nr:ABC transporter permease [Bryobacteraceae bacterium]